MTDADNWNAEDYAKHSTQQKKWARELIARLHLKDGEDVLDIGCGDGLVTAQIAALTPTGRVVGINYAPDMIAHAARHYPAEKHPNLSFRVTDARELAFEEEFDVVFSNAVLHWVRDHAPVVRGIARALRPGGRLLLQMGGQGNAAGMIAAHDEVRARTHWRQWFENFEFPYGFLGVQDYQHLLAEAGLQAQQVELIEKDMQHEGREGLAGWVRTTWMPYATCVPQDRREDFIAEVVDTYLEHHPLDEAGKAHVAMVRLQVQARKPA